MGLINLIFPFDHAFAGEVERCGGERAQDILTNYEATRQTPPRRQKDIQALAQREAERFYQSGHLWHVLIVQARFIGSRQQVTETYKNAFIDTYATILKNEEK